MALRTLLVLLAISLHTHTTDGHPQCLDFGPPFEVRDKLEFCPEYVEFGCCSKAQDKALLLRYKAILSRYSQWSAECQDYVRTFLCQECSPYAAHIFDSEATQVKRSLPGLCTSYCNDFYNKCQGIVQYVTNDAQILENLVSPERFCNSISLTDTDYCFPGLLQNPVLNNGIRPETHTEEGCLCLEPFAGQLRNPLLFRTPPDGSGRIFIAEQVGLVHIYYSNKTKVEEPFMDLVHMVLTSSNRGDERGFLGFAFHPNFLANQKFYIYFSISHENTHKTRVSEFTVNSTDENKVDLDSERVVLQVPQPYWNHNGGELFFGTDGYLYVSLGDGGSGGDPQGNAQNKDTLLGKILRIDVDHMDPGLAYGIPPDNPFVGETGARPEIYALGCRNMWRCDVDEGDPDTGYGRGRIFCGDVGQSAYEEVDIIVKGGNYGWNAREGFQCYRDDLCGRIGEEVFPIHAYSHTEGKSITGGHVYRGCLNPNLQGRYIYGDFVRGRIWSLTENVTSHQWKNSVVQMCDSDVCFNGLQGTYETNILSFGEDQEGEIYLLTTSYASSESPEGKVYKIIDPRRRGDPTKCRSYVAEEEPETVTYQTTDVTTDVDLETEESNITQMSTTKHWIPGSGAAMVGFPIQTCILFPVMTCVTYFI